MTLDELKVIKDLSSRCVKSNWSSAGPSPFLLAGAINSLVAEVERLRELVKKAQARICSDVCSSEHCDLCLELRDGDAR